MLKYHIQTIELSSSSSSITFNSIPQTYSDLYLVFSMRTDASSTNADIGLNGSYSDFSVRSLFGSGSGVTSETTVRIVGAITNQTPFTNGSVYIPNYTSSVAKSISIDTVSENNGTTAYQTIWAGLWNPATNTAITSLSLREDGGGNILQYSSASLYGIKRGSDGKTEVASGGVITTSGGYTIHTFNTSGTFVANRNLNVDYLVVAGGGGGGMTGGGGGGAAGGLRSSVTATGGGASLESALSVSSSTSYLVTVGAGGAGSSAGGQNAADGSNSVFGSILAIGGGGGTSGDNNGRPGGSGGGAGMTGGLITYTGGAGTTNQGFAGGTNFGDGSGGSRRYQGGGGGGAGALGNNGSVGQAGAGGAGVSVAITGSSVAYAGGGGGAGGRESSAPSSQGAAGGTGGGGTGAGDSSSSTAGTTNLGGGGGGGRTVPSVTSGKNGGSGVVIIRYLTPA
jgi:hypothetical protein